MMMRWAPNEGVTEETKETADAEETKETEERKRKEADALRSVTEAETIAKDDIDRLVETYGLERPWKL